MSGQNKKETFCLDFVGIGAAKSGTTWVANMLAAHPQVYISEPKEIKYFNKRPAYTDGELNPNFDKSLEWYKKHFTHCRSDSVKGEFSPVYFPDLHAPERIKKTFPDVKLITCLRNPVDRAYSEYNHYKYFKRTESRSFEVVVGNEPDYIERGLYYKQLSEYLRYFERGKLLVIFFEEIKKNPESVLRRLYNFLGVESTFAPANFEQRANVGKVARFGFMFSFVEKFIKFLVQWRMVWLIKLLKRLRINRFVLKLYTKERKVHELDETIRLHLKNAFLHDIEKLEKLLDKDLTAWR